MSEEESNTYQMLWDCPACGTSGLLGLDHRFCPGCGSPQDAKNRYFPSDDQKVLVEDHRFTGADQVCGACGTANGSSSGFCQACGSPLDDAKAVQRRADRVVGEGESDGGETSKDARAEVEAARRAREAARIAENSGQSPPSTTPAKGGGSGPIFLGLIALIGLVVVGIIGFICLNTLWSTNGEVTVASHEWSRSIEIERYDTVRETAWKDETPRGARIISCSEKQRGTQKIADGEECNTRKKDNGDGTFSEKRECKTLFKEVPTMDQSCRFEIDRWSTTRTAKSSGVDLQPKWPEANLKRTGNCIGCAREGQRSESYTVKLTDPEGGSHSCAVAEKTWRALTPGSTVAATFGGLTGSLNCGSLRP